jgi:hypothetical protein
VFRERIHTMDNLKKKRWKGEERCLFCLERESVDHLLFRCSLLVYIQVVVRDGMQYKECKKIYGEFYVFEGRQKEWKINFPIWSYLLDHVAQ